MNYQSIEVPEIISTNTHSGFVHNLGRFKLTTIVDLSIAIGDPKRNGTFKVFYYLPYNTPNHKRISASSRHG